MMPLKVQRTAQDIAATLSFGRDLPSWADLRDICDCRTGGDLDCFQLDLLTDTVERILKRRVQKGGGR